jgi:hypothetical protein
MRRLSGNAVLLGMALAAAPALADYPFYEADRRAQISMQIGLNDHLRWLSGLRGGLGDSWGPSLDDAYSGLGWTGRIDAWNDVFEPWPLIPGDIYGGTFDRPARQPAGHVITPDGRGGYTYEPLYASPYRALPTRPAPEVAPPVAPLPAPRAVAPPVEILPAPPEELREF